MLEQILLAMVTSAGSATLAWYLCAQYMGMEARKREEQLRERQRRSERQVASLKARLETQILHARLEEVRGVALLLAGHFPEMMLERMVSIESQMALATRDLKKRREPLQRRKQASLMPARTHETIEVCGRGVATQGPAA
jgi:hypothetical protein